MKFTAATVVAILLPSLLSGCMNTKPREFLIPENKATYEEGEALIEEGETLIAKGEARIDEGRRLRKKADKMIREGRDIKVEGEEIARRGRTAVSAARMLEEAEKLRRDGEAARQALAR